MRLGDQGVNQYGVAVAAQARDHSDRNVNRQWRLDFHLRRARGPRKAFDDRWPHADRQEPAQRERPRPEAEEPPAGVVTASPLQNAGMLKSSTRFAS